MLFLLISTPRGTEAQPRAEAELTVAEPESVGFSSERLRRIHDAIHRHIAGNRTSGAVTLVAREGRVVHFDAHGLMDVEAERPMRKDALFVLASMTKPITGAAVLMLAEEGKLRLTDPVSKFIPEFDTVQVAVRDDSTSCVRLVEADRRITIRDLLTHTSGLGSGSIGTQAGPDVPWPLEPGTTLADHVPRWAEVPLDFQPETRWSYSPQAGMDVLARIVEVASGQPFDAFLRHRIFAPLDMTDTFFIVPDEKRERLAPIYEVTNDGFAKADQAVIPFAETYFSGAVGLVSSAQDYLQFAQMLLNGGRWNSEQLLSPRAVELFASNHVGTLFEGQLGRPQGMGFGLTVEVVEDAVRAGTFSSNGSVSWGGAYGTYFLVDAKQQLVALMMTHTSPSVAGEIQEDFATTVMQAIVE